VGIFYCEECDKAPVEHKLNKDNFYHCAECNSTLSVVRKDDEEE
jgi:hypothetical protein